ncbi:MAG: ATP-binding protein [Pseudomonadota bacterium]
MITSTLWVLAMAGVALLSGILLALGITRPLKELKRKGEEILNPFTLQAHQSEIDDLAQVFNQMVFSMNQFIQDSQIIDNLPEGLIILDASGVITKSNKLADEIFGIPLEGRTYQETIPSDPVNEMFLDCVPTAFRRYPAPYPRETRFKNIHGHIFSILVSCFPLNAPYGLGISIKNMEELEQIRDKIRQTESLAQLGTLSSILSHEIKNPLGSIRGLLELIQEGLVPEEKRKDYVDRIIREIDRLTNLSEDFLGLVRLDEGSLDVREPINLTDLLGQALFMTQHEFQDKKISPVEDYATDLPPVNGDPERLTQAFVNLIINAFQAAPEGGRVSVTTERLVSGLSVCIYNSGSYIPPADRESIFMPTYSTKQRGSGFGLFLAKRIIAAHGGAIEIRSEPEAGTTFCISFRLNDKGGTRAG